MRSYRIAGFAFFSRASNESKVLVSYHPRRSGTWHWAVYLEKRKHPQPVGRSTIRRGQWHDYYWLPFGYRLIVSQQDYHKGRVA